MDIELGELTESEPLQSPVQISKSHSSGIQTENSKPNSDNSSDTSDENEKHKFGDSKYKKRVKPIIERYLTSLEPLQRKIIMKRYVNEVERYEKKARKSSRSYTVLRTIVTLGSLTLPALLSLQQMDQFQSENAQNNIYWGTWSISLLVTACNGIIQLFSIDKNYFTLNIVAEKLKAEGWQFFELTGPYRDFENHKDAYSEFCQAIEEIKSRQVSQEFSESGKSSMDSVPLKRTHIKEHVEIVIKEQNEILMETIQAMIDESHEKHPGKIDKIVEEK